MSPERAIWLWPKSRTESLLEFLLFLFVLYLIFKVIGYYTRRSENAKINWYRLNQLATKRGLRWGQRRILYHFFHQLTLRHRENLFKSPHSMLKQLFHYLASEESEESTKYLELLSLLDKNHPTELRNRNDFRGILDINTSEVIAFRIQKRSGLAIVSEKLDGQILLSVKGKKYGKIPNHCQMEAFVYRTGVGLLLLKGKAQKMSHNTMLFSAK